MGLNLLQRRRREIERRRMMLSHSPSLHPAPPLLFFPLMNKATQGSQVSLTSGGWLLQGHGARPCVDVSAALR